MKTVTVSASRRYDILIERGLLRRAGELVRGVTNTGTVMLVSDDSVWLLYGETVQKSLVDAGFSVCRFVFPHGESSKCAKTYLALLDALCENRLTRADAALALGGGQRRVKEAVSRGVYKIVGCTAVLAAIHVQPVADEVVPFVAFVRAGAALRGHKAVGAAAEQPQDVVGERNELARPHATAVQVGFIVLQKDKLPVAAAVVFCTKASVAALCQRL